MEASGEGIKEVYARFGLAYYMGEVLHKSLCHLYVGLQTVTKGATRLRIEEVTREAYAETFGGILNRVADVLSKDLEQRLRIVLEKRNYLAHHFWFEKVHLLYTAEGVLDLVKQLEAITNEFELVNEELEVLTRADLLRFGVTAEVLEGMLVLASKEAMEPLPTQRRLKKVETVIAAYEAPLPNNGKILIFETDDHALWQLCEVGLGWSCYEQVEQTWRPVEQFKTLLPTRIRPRPESTAPWQYEIDFGVSATLVVRLAADGRNSIYRIRRKNTAEGTRPKP
jgi:hypothetical protein